MALVFFLTALLFPAPPAFAGGLTVHDGATVTLNGTTLDLNCRDLIVESGGTFDLDSGTITECGTLIIQDGGSLIQATGIINYCEATLPPAADTRAATNVGTTSATLNGLVNANGGGTTVAFQYGMTTAYGTMATAGPSPVNGSADTAVSAGVTGLTPGTTYHFRVVAQNTVGTTYGSDLTFTTPTNLPPTATTQPPTTVGTTTATLNGTVNANGTGTTVTFQYGLSAAYGTTLTADQNPVNGFADTAVSVTVSGLTTGLTYHYRVVAGNAGGTTYGADMTFLPGTTPPTAVTGGASGIGATTATLNGTVYAGGTGTTVTFEYGPTAAYGETAVAVPGTVTGFTSTAVNASLSALAPNTTYHFRVVGINSGGTARGADRTFTTPAAPTVTTDPAWGPNSSGATLNGTVNANGTSTTVTFEYGLTAAYGTTVTADQNPVNGSADTAVSVTVSGLNADTVYHYRAVGQNAQGTTCGGDGTFFTSAPAAPAAATQAATLVIAGGAVLNGMVNPHNAATTVLFEYGLDTGYGQTAFAGQSPVSGTTDTPVNAAIGELQPDTTYHFRVAAANASGTVFGSDLTFETPPLPPSAMTWPASAVGGDGATLNGQVNPRGTATTVTFEYGPTAAYGTTVAAAQSPLTTSLTYLLPVDAVLSGLADNTIYHFRVVAANAGGSVRGNDMTFILGTVGTVPTATTAGATAADSTTAILNGAVNPGGAETAVTFEYGLTEAYGTSVTASQSPVSGDTAAAVSAALGELEPETTYHFKVVAANANGSDNGEDMTFTTLPPAPTAVTGAASSVGTTTATLNGSVNAGGTSTTVTFEYGLTTAYGTTVTADQSPVNGSTDTPVNRAISGLTNGLSYHYRIVAVNAGGTTCGEDRTFTPGVMPPNAVTNGASGVGDTAATLNGTVNANGTGTTVTFEYGLTTAYGHTAIPVPGTVTGSSGTAVSALLSALIPNTTYHFRVVGINAGGTAQGEDRTLTTLAAPTVTTHEASGVSSSGATLNGEGNANGTSTTVTFEYGLTTTYGTTVTAGQSPVTGSSNTAVSRAVTGLIADTIYHYRVVGQNARGTTFGGDRTFVTTTGAAPAVTTDAATSVLYNGATLNGTVTANNAGTTVTFEYGLTIAYGTTVTADQSPVTGVGVPVGKTITGLTFNQTYHYRAVGQNDQGTTYGGDMTFTTSLDPAVAAYPATNVLNTSATLNGMVNANSQGFNIYFEYSTDLIYSSSLSATPTSVSGNSDTPVSANITGLTPNTLYNYRVRAFSGLNYYYSGNMTFTTLTGPTVTTNAASPVGGRTATLKGTVNANNNGTNVIFEYGGDTGYGRTITADQSPASGSVDTAVSASCTDLTPNSTYHYRAIGQNTEGTVYGADMTFTTLGIPPTAVTGAAEAVTTTGATLNGTVNAENDTATVTFQYGLTTAYGGTATADQNPVTGAIDTAVSDTLSGLTADTTYHYRLAARNTSGTTYGEDRTFFTGVLPPVVTTGEATDVETDGATLHGTVNARNGNAAVIFEYGETTGYGRTAAAAPSPVTGSADTAVSAGIDMLNAETLYHYRVCAENSAGRTCGGDRTLTTDPAGLPAVTTAAVTAIAAVSATGGGNVTDTGYYPTTARGICWSTSPRPTVAHAVTSNGTGAGAFMCSLTGLSPQTTYYVRAYATNAVGTGYGHEVFFSTTASPAIPTLSEWGMIVFALLMAGTAIVFLRRRKDLTE